MPLQNKTKNMNKIFISVAISGGEGESEWVRNTELLLWVLIINNVKMKYYDLMELLMFRFSRDKCLLFLLLLLIPKQNTNLFKSWKRPKIQFHFILFWKTKWKYLTKKEKIHFNFHVEKTCRQGERERERYAENNVNRINKLKYWISWNSYTNFIIFNVFDKHTHKKRWKKGNNWTDGH